MKLLQVVPLAIVAVALATATSAQRGMCCGGNYDVSTEATVTGTIDTVTTMPSPGRGGGGLHLILTTSSGPIEIRVGPASFVSSKHVTFTKGDALTVAGSMLTMGGRSVLIAREITKGGEVLALRDARGFPLWAGRGAMR